MSTNMMASEAIKPDDILKELGAHWRDLGTHGEAEGDGLLRACSMTLTCFADDEEDASLLGEVLASLMPEDPSRLIVVRLKDGEDEFTARVAVAMLETIRTAGRQFAVSRWK